MNGDSTEDFQSNGTLLCDTVIVNTGPYTFFPSP